MVGLLPLMDLVPAKARLLRQNIAAETSSHELTLPKSQAPPFQALIAPLKPIQAATARHLDLADLSILIYPIQPSTKPHNGYQNPLLVGLR